MAKLLKVLGIITLIAGIVGSIVLAVHFGAEKKLVATYDVISYKIKFDLGTFLGVLLGGLLSTTVLSCLLFGESKILEYLQGKE